MTKWLALFLLASTAYGQQVSVTPIPDCSSGFCSGLGVPTFNCFSGQKYAQVDNAGHNFTCTGIPPHWVADAVGGGGGGSIPAANQVISGDGTGNAVAMPEKGTTLVTGSPNTAAVAWDEDVASGRFDCRNTAYAGGCLGPTPAAAMQAFSDRLICYQATTGNHARTTFPPMSIAVGTPTKPTLKLPIGAIYEGAGGWGFATTATTFQATYNNVNAIEFDGSLTPSTGSACIIALSSVANQSGGLTTYTGAISGGASNALFGRTFTVAGFTNSLNNGTYTVAASTATSLTLHNATGNAETHVATAIPTSLIGGGSYDGFAEHGCGQGGCSNVSGDGANYPFGGPGQHGIVFTDADGSIAQKAGVFASNNGADGIVVNGSDTHVFHIGGSSNNEFFIFGIDVAGQNYQFSPGECHGEVTLGGLDDINVGPTETYGLLTTLGAEYSHLAGICWSGGLTELGTYFANRPQVGIIHMTGGNTQTGAKPGRIDGAAGTGILEQSSGLTTWDNPRVIAACRADGLNDYIVYSVATATLGSGQTPGTYLLNASTGSAQILVTVGGGGTVTGVATTVHGRAYTSTPPTFTLAAGGTPATFAVTMHTVFFKLGTGTPANDSCDYLTDNSTFNTYTAPLFIDNGFFGADHSTGDIYTDPGFDTFIAPRGNGTNHRVKWDPNLTAFYTAQANSVIDSDFIPNAGGTTTTGSVIDLSNGYHIRMANTSPVTLTNVTNGLKATSISIVGDGFTTVPYQPSIDGNTFGAVNCSLHNQVLQSNRLYQYQIAGGQLGGTPPVLVEQCDAIFKDYLQPGFEWLSANSALPATTTQATLDVAGAIAVRSYPPMPDPTITFAGSGSAFTYCIVDEVWVAGGKQISHPVCNAHTPPVSTSGGDNFQVHQALPQNWTRYQVRLNSTTDPGFTPGVWWDITAPNGLPQPAQCDFTAVIGCTTGGFGRFITKMVPTDTSVIVPANFGLNMTGTYNYDATNVPASATNPAIQGQFQIDPFGGVLWYATAEDTWKSWPLSASVADAEVPAGTIDGTNVTFTLANTPTPASSLRLYRNGLRKVSPDDYTITGNTITYANPPSPGDSHVADYRF